MEPTKRVTISISHDMQSIKERIENELGIELTYAQLVSFLIRSYEKHVYEPKTRWAAPR